MTDLLECLRAELQVHGYSVRTQEMCVLVVRLLAEHYHKPSDQVSEEELRDYFQMKRQIRDSGRHSTYTLKLTAALIQCELLIR